MDLKGEGVEEVRCWVKWMLRRRGFHGVWGEVDVKGDGL